MGKLKGGRLPYPSAQIATVASGVLRALSICAPVALVSVSTATAQAAEPALSADIPVQPLAQALAEFAHQTGLQLVYVSDLVRNQKSGTASAGSSAQDALAHLLKGTGLRFQFLTRHSVRILAAAPREMERPATSQSEPYELIVTANRREEYLQDVPITIQAISGERLKDLSVSTFNDLLKYTTNITYSGNGPATGNIFIRGLGSAGTGNQEQSTTAPFPNIALYLDDQAMQFPARNNDVYAVDLQRVEVLEGPQGTLFGGGAQAGAIRYITNEPKLDVTSGEFTSAYGVTANGGDPNVLANGVINIPLSANTLAVRAVIFSERRGGYIDNVPSTIGFVPGTRMAATGVTASNAGLAGSNTNPVSYGGLRLSGLYRFADDWTLLIQQNFQDLRADGYFYAYPYDSNGKALQRYQITAFNPAYTKDRYESTAWTLKGGLGDLRAVYTGSYMARHIEGQQDYSSYLRSAYGTYYACIGPTAGPFDFSVFPGAPGKPLRCYPPRATWHDRVQNAHQSHEVRVSSNEERRLRALVGAYWEKFVINDQMDWNDLAIPQCSPTNLAVALAGGPDCLSANGPLPGTLASDPGLRENMNSAFGEEVQRGYKQSAFFSSVDFDIVPKVLTVTAGVRRYHYDEFEEGSLWGVVGWGELLLDQPNGACTAAGQCGLPVNGTKGEGGFSSRGNVTWHITPEIMTYYTYSEGFRPGGFNRTTSAPSASLAYCGPKSTDPRCLPGGSLYSVGTAQYIKPAGFESDNLINNELGLKSELVNHRLLVNASAYQMNWNNAQLLFYDPYNLLSVNLNGPSYTIRGAEVQLAAHVAGLTVQAAGSWNHSRQTSASCLRSAGITPATPLNPTPAGQCITVVQGLSYSNPFGALNGSLPFSPSFLFNLQARYEWAAGAYQPFVLGGASHATSMLNEPANFPSGDDAAQNPPTTGLLRYTIPGYTIYDAAVGVTQNNWTAQLAAGNLTNAYGPTNISSAQFIRSEIPLRPRVLMAQVSYRF